MKLKVSHRRDQAKGAQAVQRLAAYGQRPSVARAGENIATAHLRQKGYEIVQRNWRDRRGELDIIARDHEQGCVVIVEVRTLRSDHYVRPEDTVSNRKQRQVEAQARRWMAQNRRAWQGWVVRFDVIGVVLETGETRHYEDAFRGGASGP